MIRSTSHQAWLFYSPLALQAALLKDDLLDPVDQLLDDPALLELVQQCLASRFPASARTGRPGIAPDRLLLCHEAPEGLELPRSGTGTPQQPGIPAFHLLRCRSHTGFHYLQSNLRVAESARSPNKFISGWWAWRVSKG
jgi:hypothetical protein